MAQPPAARLDLERLTAHQAAAAAVVLERRGWRAEACGTMGVAFLELRDPAIRHHPKIATLRTPADVDAFLERHPGHALVGRHPRCTGETPPDLRSVR